MELPLDFTDSAFDTLELCKSEGMHELTYAHVSNSVGVMNHFRREFLALIYILEIADEIRISCLLQMMGSRKTYSNLGNVNTSVDNLDAGLTYHGKRCGFFFSQVGLSTTGAKQLES